MTPNIDEAFCRYQTSIRGFLTGRDLEHLCRTEARRIVRLPKNELQDLQRVHGKVLDLPCGCGNLQYLCREYWPDEPMVLEAWKLDPA